jgi:hypothetical protein
MSTLQLRVPIVRVLVLALALNLSLVLNVVELAKYAVFVKACLVKWSPQARVAVVVAWAQLSLVRAQSVQAKVVHRLVSHTQLMFLEELTLDKQCA